MPVQLPLVPALATVVEPVLVLQSLLVLALSAVVEPVLPALPSLSLPTALKELGAILFLSLI